MIFIISSLSLSLHLSLYVLFSLSLFFTRSLSLSFSFSLSLSFSVCLSLSFSVCLSLSFSLSVSFYLSKKIPAVPRFATKCLQLRLQVWRLHIYYIDMGLRENVENCWSSAVVPNQVPAGIFLPPKPFSMPIRLCYLSYLLIRGAM